jgi:hypothetical protein
MTTTSKPIKVFGEYARQDGHGGMIVVAATRRGTVRDVSRLWDSLDNCSVTDVDGIIRRLRDLGAVRDVE